jgi:hypothetical protein
MVLQELAIRAFEVLEQGKWRTAVRYKLAKKAKQLVVERLHSQEDTSLLMKGLSHLVISSFKVDTFARPLEQGTTVTSLGRGEQPPTGDIFLEEDEERNKKGHLSDYVKKMAWLNSFEEAEGRA